METSSACHRAHSRLYQRLLAEICAYALLCSTGVHSTFLMDIVIESSNDHRGTPEAPGRVVTLVNAKEWHSLPYADDLPDGDCVWGCVYRIDPEYAVEVKAYLDYREKDGYSCERVDVYRKVDGIEQIVVPNVSLLVGVQSSTNELTLCMSGRGEMSSSPARMIVD